MGGVALSLTLEVNRFLTCWFLRSNRRYQQVGSVPLLDLITPRFSPICVARQYLSSLAHGVSRRLKLVTSMSGTQNIGQWAQGDPATARLFRRLIRVCSAWVFYKHQRKFWTWPYRLFAVADTRLSQREKLNLADDFWATNACCMVWGMARSIRNMAAVDLLSPSWTRVFFRVSTVARLSVADIECRHARNKRAAASKAMEFAQLGGLFIIAEIKKITTECIELFLRLKSVFYSVGAAAAAAAAKSRDALRRERWAMAPDQKDDLRKRGLSPLEVFKHQQLAKRRRAGDQCQPQKLHTVLKTEFDRLEPLEKLQCENESKRTYELAKINREIKKGLQRVPTPFSAARRCLGGHELTGCHTSGFGHHLTSYHAGSGPFTGARGITPDVAQHDAALEDLKITGSHLPVMSLGSDIGFAFVTQKPQLNCHDLAGVPSDILSGESLIDVTDDRHVNLERSEATLRTKSYCQRIPGWRDAHGSHRADPIYERRHLRSDVQQLQ